MSSRPPPQTVVPHALSQSCRPPQSWLCLLRPLSCLLNLPMSSCLQSPLALTQMPFTMPSPHSVCPLTWVWNGPVLTPAILPVAAAAMELLLQPASLAHPPRWMG
ncbi:rCG25303, partial [Rattus norvegicus]